MDRSFRSQKSSLIFLFLFLLPLLKVTTSVAEENNKTSVDKKEKGKKEEKKPDGISGIFLGKMGFLDKKGRFITATSLLKGYQRYFYIDSKTKVKLFGSKASKEDLKTKQDIRIDYISDGKIYLADIISIEHSLLKENMPKAKNNLPTLEEDENPFLIIR